MPLAAAAKAASKAASKRKKKKSSTGKDSVRKLTDKERKKMKAWERRAKYLNPVNPKAFPMSKKGKKKKSGLTIKQKEN